MAGKRFGRQTPATADSRLAGVERGPGETSLQQAAHAGRRPKRTGGSSIRSSAVNVQINGTGFIYNGWLLDGIDITEYEQGGKNVQPNVDALQECTRMETYVTSHHDTVFGDLPIEEHSSSNTASGTIASADTRSCCYQTLRGGRAEDSDADLARDRRGYIEDGRKLQPLHASGNTGSDEGGVSRRGAGAGDLAQVLGDETGQPGGGGLRPCGRTATARTVSDRSGCFRCLRI